MAKRTRKSVVPKVKVTLVKSTIGYDNRQAAVVRGLGLRRLGHCVELPDAPSIRGILFFSSLVVIIANLLTDMVYRIIDPRIKTSAESQV